MAEFFARRVDDLKSFLRYLPQLICEQYNDDSRANDEYSIDTKTGKPYFDYSGIREPLLRLAFASGKAPVRWEVTKIEVEREDLEYRAYHKHLRGFKPRFTPVIENDYRPVYYAEFVGLPSKEIVEHDSTPISSAHEPHCSDCSDFECRAMAA